MSVHASVVKALIIALLGILALALFATAALLLTSGA